MIKFSYLRELLDYKVKKIVEGLLYIVEGYNCVVFIFKDRFGKEGEIVNVYVKELFDLFYIFILNVRKIYEFYDKFLYCV